jgi:hypothetical protein
MRRHHHELDASVGASGPHGFAVREWHRSSSDASRPSHPTANVRDDRDPPLMRGETGGVKAVIWVKREAEYFYVKGWTEFRDLPDRQGDGVTSMGGCAGKPACTARYATLRTQNGRRL